MATTMDFPRRIPFVEHLGLQLVSLGDGKAELALAVQPHQMNSLLVAHGGVVMTLLDVAMAHAARSRASDPLELAAPSAESSADPAADAAATDKAALAQGVVTIEMKTSFMRASHGEVRAVGRLLHRTPTMAFCEGSVYDAAGLLCAHATGTFKYVRGLAGHAARQAAQEVALDAREEAQEVIQQAAQHAAEDVPAAAQPGAPATQPQTATTTAATPAATTAATPKDTSP